MQDCAAYADAGVSGVTLERPELQRLIADCRAGRIGTLVTKDPDRLSRDTGQLIALLHIFQATGVGVEFSTRAGQNRYASHPIYLSALLQIDEATMRSKPKHR